MRRLASFSAYFPASSSSSSSSTEDEAKGRFATLLGRPRNIEFFFSYEHHEAAVDANQQG